MKAAGLLIAFAAAGLAAEQAQIAGPVLGYVLDRDAGGVRLLAGLPGAAWTAGAVALGIDVDRAALASGPGYVLAAAAGTGQVQLIRGLPAAAETLVIDGVAPSPDRIVLSPSVSAAALYYRDSNLLQLVTGLPGAPALHGRIDLSTLPGPVLTLAVSDDAEWVLASAAAGGQGESVFLLRPDGTVQYLAPAGHVSAAAFLHGGSDAAFADSGANAVYLVRSQQLVPLDGVDAGAALQLSADNRRLFVANPDAGAVSMVNLDGGPPGLVSCGCRPALLEPLEGNAVFRLTEPSGGPVWVLDADAPSPRVVFVPPAASETGGDQ